MRNFLNRLIFATLFTTHLVANADVQINASALNLSPLALPACSVDGQLRVDASFALWICDSGSWTTIGGASAWGGITGTLADQTDLQNALNAKKTDSMATSRILGRTSGGTGVIEELTVGGGLTLSGGALTGPSLTGYVPYSGATGAVDLGAQNLTTTGTVTLNRSALTTTPTTAELLANTTAAVTGSRVQVSPALQFRGNGWRTGTSVNHTVDFRQYVLPVTGTSAAFGDWKLQSSINGGAYEDGLTYSSRMSDGLSFGRLSVEGNIKSTMPNSSTIDTLQNLDLSSTGSRVNTTHSFGSTIRSGQQTTSDGAVSFYAAGSQASYYFNLGSTIGSQQYLVQLYGGGIYNTQGSYNGSYLTAGQSDITPPATFSNFGSTALKGRLVEADYTAAATETSLFCDTSTANSCTGTPSTACSSTAYGAACTARALVGCTNNTTGNCSDYNSTDSGTCTGANAACTWDTAACSAYNNDVTSCNAAGFPSGSQCSFTANVCSDFYADNSSGTCPAGDGCTANFGGDCTTLSDGGGDGTACATRTDCSYNSGDGVCSGSFYDSCTGTYTGANGACSGSYALGTCSGGAFGNCGGTALCSNLTASGSGTCTGEAGCAWTAGFVLTLPAISSVEEGGTGRLHAIVKINSGAGTVTLATTGTDTFPSTFDTTLSAEGESRVIQPFTKFAQCSTFNNDNTECSNGATHPGCSFAAATCADFGANSGTCGAASGCTWNDPNCEGTYSGPNGSCSGQYPASRKWYQLAN